MNLAPLLNIEILRIAKAEQKTDEAQMKTLMEELAALCDVKVRTVYHWRSGFRKLPSDHVPALCQRFSSRALLHELNRATETAIEVPETYDLALLASRSVREDLAVYEKFLTHFESDGIQPGEMAELRELGARIHRNTHQLLEIAEADCARRQAAEAPPRKGSVTSEKRDRGITGSANPVIPSSDPQPKGITGSIPVRKQAGLK